MTVRTALLQGTELLDGEHIAAPRLTAEVLLAYAMHREREWFYAHPEAELPEVAWIHYGRYLHERLKGKPTQYITHCQEFYGREFRVTRDVLIPRPETEHVAEAALARIRPGHRILDAGCGSGAIGVTLALERPVSVYATDVSWPALRVAAANAARLGARVAFLACDLASAFAPSSLDMVVSNPPYVPLRDAASLQREIREWEPPVALYGGDDGLEICRRLVDQAAVVLRPGGWLIAETAYNASEAMRGLLANWTNVAIECDLAGLPRVAIAERVR